MARIILFAALLAVVPVATRASAATPSPSTNSHVALVIGNARYAEAPLKNPVNDARAVAAALTRIGFAVTIRENMTRAAMKEAARAFVLETRAAAVRVFYFAGHGLQLRGRNYLLPVDVHPQNENEVTTRTLDATELTEQLGAIETGANVIIIDACREHPVFQTSRKMWAVRPGFAQVVAPRGTLVAFSTRPGKVARDGDGANSIYATALTRALADFPTLPVEIFFKRVRTAVVEATRNEQVPWDSSDLYGELCFRSEPNGLCRQFQ